MKIDKNYDQKLFINSTAKCDKLLLVIIFVNVL